MIEKIQEFVDLIISMLTVILLLIKIFEKVSIKKKPRNRKRSHEQKR